MKFNEKFKLLCLNLGKHIQKIREEKGITIAEMSKRTGIITQYLIKIEKGVAYGVLIDKHLSKIATALEIKLSKLFEFIS